IALVLLAQYVFRPQLSAHGRYLLWWPVLLALVLPPGLTLPLPASVFPATAEATATLPALAEASPAAFATQEPPSLTGTAAAFRFAALDLADWLPLLWLAGVLLVAGLFLRAARRGLVLTHDTVTA